MIYERNYNKLRFAISESLPDNLSEDLLPYEKEEIKKLGFEPEEWFLESRIPVSKNTEENKYLHLDLYSLEDVYHLFLKKKS